MRHVRWISAGLFYCMLLIVSTGFVFTTKFGIRDDSIVYVNPTLGIGVFSLLAFLWVFGARKKMVILFLRHFNDQSANQLLSAAMYGALRSSGRLVVLDDSDFKPVQMPWRERVLGVITAALIVMGLAVLGLIGSAATGSVDLTGPGQFFRSAGFVSVLRPESAGSLNVSIGVASVTRSQSFQIGGFAARYQASYGTFTVNSVPDDLFDREFSHQRGLVATSLPDSLPLYALIAALVYFLRRTLRRSWEAKQEVRMLDDIGPITQHMHRLRSRLFAPRLLGVLATVLKVADDYWKDVVQRAAEAADHIVIDCSFPSDSILWELDLCRT